MTDQELDRLIRRAILDSIEREQEQLEIQEAAGEIPPFRPSVRHRRQIKAMLANPLRWAHRKKQPVWKKVAQRAAVFVLIGTLGFVALGLFTSNVQASVFRWVIKQKGNQISYVFGGEPISEEFPMYEITELPQGYVQTEVWYQPPLPVYNATYGNGDENDVIYFQYEYMEQGGAINLNLDEIDTVTDVTVNGLEGMLIASSIPIPGRFNRIIWIDKKSNLIFNITTALSKDEIMHMAESVSLVKTPK